VLFTLVFKCALCDLVSCQSNSEDASTWEIIFMRVCVCVCGVRVTACVAKRRTRRHARPRWLRTLYPRSNTVTDFALCFVSSSCITSTRSPRARRHSSPSTLASHGVRSVQAFVAVSHACVIASRRRRRESRGGAGAIRRAARETRWRTRGVGCRRNVAGISNAMRAIMPGINVYRCRARGGCVRAIDG